AVERDPLRSFLKRMFPPAGVPISVRSHAQTSTPLVGENATTSAAPPNPVIIGANSSTAVSESITASSSRSFPIMPARKGGGNWLINAATDLGVTRQDR